MAAAAGAGASRAEGEEELQPRVRGREGPACEVCG